MPPNFDADRVEVYGHCSGQGRWKSFPRPLYPYRTSRLVADTEHIKISKRKGLAGWGTYDAVGWFNKEQLPKSFTLRRGDVKQVRVCRQWFAFVVRIDLTDTCLLPTKSFSIQPFDPWFLAQLLSSLDWPVVDSTPRLAAAIGLAGLDYLSMFLILFMFAWVFGMLR